MISNTATVTGALYRKPYVAGLNTPPTVYNTSLTTNEDTTGAVGLPISDPDAGDTFGFQITSGPYAGSAAISGSTLYYYPPANWNGTTSLSYRAWDNKGAYSNTATVTIRVNPVNDPPYVSNRTLAMNEDTVGTLGLAVSDIDLSYEGDSHTYSIVSAPNAAHGTASISGSTLTFRPVNDWNGTTSLTYRTVDSRGAISNTATVTITVNPVNDTPIVTDQAITLAEDGSATITLPVSDVDLTREGDSHTWSVVSPPNAAHGSASIVGNKLTFTAASNWNGTTSLTYRATDSKGGNSAAAKVTVTVTPVNDVPDVDPRTMILDEDNTASITLAVNDVDLQFEGDSHTYALIDSPDPRHGSATITDNVLTFVPVLNWNGVTTLTYQATDSHGAKSNIETVTITVNPVNDIPVVSPVSKSIPEDTYTVITLQASDVDNDPPFVFEITSALDPAEGSFSISDGKLTVTPVANFNGTLSLTYRAMDAAGGWSTPSTISVEITAVNDTPLGTWGNLFTYENQTSEPSQPWVYDVDNVYGDTHTFEVEVQPQNGSAKIVAGKIVYTPNTQFYGTDDFTIRATDSEGESVTGPVAVSVLKFNYAPNDITPSSIHVYEGVGGSAVLSAVDINTWDSHVFTVVEQPEHGLVTIDGDKLTYRTSGDTDASVKIRVTDQEGLSFEKNISLKFGDAWAMFDDRPVVATSAAPSTPAVTAFMKRADGSSAFQLIQPEVIAALGSEIIAIVTPTSTVGLGLQDRVLAPGKAMRLTPNILTADLLEASIAGKDVGVDGVAMVFLSRADMTGDVYSVPVHVWAPEGSLSADSWSLMQGIGRTNITFEASNTVCAESTKEDTASRLNVLDTPTCLLEWSATPDEWSNTSNSNTLSMAVAASATIGKSPVTAKAYVFDQAGTRYQIGEFTNELEVSSIAGAMTYELQPAPTEAYQSVEQFRLSIRQATGSNCEPTDDAENTKKRAAIWGNRPLCLIRWLSLPEGMSPTPNYQVPQITGAFDVQGDQQIQWSVSTFTPSGKEVQISTGDLVVKVSEPPPIEIEAPTTNNLINNLYAVPQDGGSVGTTTTTAMAADLRIKLQRDGETLEDSVVPNYGRNQRVYRQVTGVENALWSITPHDTVASYKLLPRITTTKEIQLLSVPKATIRPVILNDEKTMLDTETLQISVRMTDTRNPQDAYSETQMGNWDIRLVRYVSASTSEPITDWQAIDKDGTTTFDLSLESLTNNIVRVNAEARVRSPVPEYSSIRLSPTPLVLSVLNGDAIDGEIKALRIMGQAPLRTSFFAVTKDRWQSMDLGSVRWEMSKDNGVSWETVENPSSMTQRLSWIFDKGQYLVRAELTNKNSGAKSMTPTVEVIAYLVPAARMKGPSNVFAGDKGKFHLTNIDGTPLDPMGKTIEWSEDRGKTWVQGTVNYEITRPDYQRVYLMARLKYSDSPEDSRVYKVVRAGVYFRAVRPPRVQIIGSRRPEVGKEAKWIANMMMPYPNMDLVMDGEFILPNGEVIKAKEANYTPVPEDLSDEARYIGFRAWIEGYEDKGGAGLTQHRLTPWSYDWPNWAIQPKMSAVYAPADLTLKARSLGSFREFEGLKMEWEIPVQDGLEIVKESTENTRVLKITQPGDYTFGLHVSDDRGNYSFVEKTLSFAEPEPWSVSLKWSGDNDANRAPLGVLVRPSITGGHPKDRIEEKIFYLDGNNLDGTGSYGRAYLDVGTHTVTMTLRTQMGKTATGLTNITVAANKAPTCELEVRDGRTSWLAEANCNDEDGRVVKHQWYINGEKQDISSRSISVPMWRYDDIEPVITLSALDDSGAESPPVANK